MIRTSATKPDDKKGFISTKDIWWNADLGFEGPCEGGFFTSLGDLHRFGDAVLQNKLLSPVQNRKWLEPVTATSSSGLLIGQPWEIFRAEDVTSDSRMVEIYTESGDLISYHSIFVLIPDYDLVATLLVAGPGGPSEASSSSMTLMVSRSIQTLLPAVEAAGESEASQA
ncbi:hypothetical protein N0V88_002921 [Collariella sp. IMI 366227]|nr:hypothetical protein N0V88_002921 [Collariella sp. IMI 366227]